jgi:hypothetical protein
MKTALLLGAGFSKWAAGLPLVSELFDFQVQPWNQRDARKLERIVDQKHRWDAVNPSAPPEIFVAEMMAASDRQKRLVSWYITRRLQDGFIAKIEGGSQALMIDDRRKLQHDGVVMARTFLDGVSDVGLCGIVTTNYDLLVEYALGTPGFNYGVPNEVLTGRGKNPWFASQGTPVRLAGTLPLAKIHGSVSWNGLTHYTDGRCGVKGDALIVLPTPGKAIPELLQPVWKLGGDILMESERLLVFGFAFNEYDAVTLDLFERSSSGIRSVLMVDPRPNLDTAARILPAAEIVTCEPPPGGTSTLTTWLNT